MSVCAVSAANLEPKPPPAAVVLPPVTTAVEEKQQQPPPRIIEVRCGSLRAHMHLERFVCPGIHQPCIELHGRFLTPKEFTVQANKDKQKDWKGSIRIGKSNLRALMEMRSLDFHQHKSQCSAKCQSRNYITPKAALATSTTSHGSTTNKTTSPAKRPEQHQHHHHPHHHEERGGDQTSSGSSTRRSSSSKSSSIDPQHFGALHQSHHHKLHAPVATVPDVVAVTRAKLAAGGWPTANGGGGGGGGADALHSLHLDHMKKLMTNQPVLFWHWMSSAGLLAELLDLLVDETDKLRRRATALLSSGSPPNEQLCRQLSSVVMSIGAADSLNCRVHARHVHAALESQLASQQQQQQQQPFAAVLSSVLAAAPTQSTSSSSSLMSDDCRARLHTLLRTHLSNSSSVLSTVLPISPFHYHRSSRSQLSCSAFQPTLLPPSDANNNSSSNNNGGSNSNNHHHGLNQASRLSSVLDLLAAGARPPQSDAINLPPAMSSSPESVDSKRATTASDDGLTMRSAAVSLLQGCTFDDESRKRKRPSNATTSGDDDEDEKRARGGNEQSAAHSPSSDSADEMLFVDVVESK